MCGIVGIYNFLSDRPVARDDLQVMSDLVAHRGPDDEGFFTEGALGFGHRRLSILDLSANGHQPMFSDDGRLVITYNGEVYNYLELREQLQGLGYRFRTGTDTEVILNAYAHWGDDCLSRLSGMFAFAIWDAPRRRLLLARDRLGIKPLYYALTGEGLVFASELKALAQRDDLSAVVDMPALDAYMLYGFVPGEKTLLRAVRKLSPGHTLTITDRVVESKAYWDLRFTSEATGRDEVHAQRLHEVLLQTVQTHLRSDVPVGVLLSGGLDSSTITALVRELGHPQLKTFSVAFDSGSNYNETPYARLVSRRFDTDHYEKIVSPAEFREAIPDMVWHMDEPTTDSAAISLYYVAQLARRHVKVILSGEGADEVFAGYEVYFNMQLLDRYRRLPAFLRRRLAAWAARRGPYSKLNKYSRLSERPLHERYLGPNVYDRVLADYLYGPDTLRVLGGYRAETFAAQLYHRTADAHPLNQMLYLDTKGWLVDDILLKADRMSMAHSLELRVPFLDHRIVEFAAALPPHLKLRRWNGKYILRRAMAERLPSPILRRKKMGFPTPLSILLRRELKEYVVDTLNSARARGRGYFQQNRLQALLQDYIDGRHDYTRLIWQLLVFEEWQRAFVDGEGRTQRVALTGVRDRASGV